MCHLVEIVGEQLPASSHDEDTTSSRARAEVMGDMCVPLLPLCIPKSTRQTYHEQSGESKRLRALVSLGHLQCEGGQGALTPQLTGEAPGGCITSILHCRLKSGSVGANSSGGKMHSHEGRLVGGDDELCGLDSHGEGIGRLGPAWLDAEVHSGLHLPIRPANQSASVT